MPQARTNTFLRGKSCEGLASKPSDIMKNSKLVTLCAAMAATPSILIAGEEYPELPHRISNETAEAKTERMAWWTEVR